VLERALEKARLARIASCFCYVQLYIQDECIVIYLDNHATTPCDPVAAEQMSPLFTEVFANPHSSHQGGKLAANAIDQALHAISQTVNTDVEKVIVTSGATESNALAIRGAATHPRQKRRHLVSVESEHPAVLDVLKDLKTDGFSVTLVPVVPQGQPNAGTVDLNQLEAAITSETALVSVMWANNEIGAINPMSEISSLCSRHGCLLHSDATQALGRLDVDLQSVKIDLLSATAHKFYGPKGTGFLVVGGGDRRVRLRPQMIGGGQQSGMRSGTMNPAGIVGMAVALQRSVDDLKQEPNRISQLRDRLWSKLSSAINGLILNGPSLERHLRLSGNLNLQLPDVEGQAWMSSTPEVLFSSGSACSGHEPAPSHVLTSLGLSESESRRSVRFGVGRFTSIDEIESAADQLIDAYTELANMPH
jgi:cysteine desulfurase